MLKQKYREATKLVSGFVHIPTAAAAAAAVFHHLISSHYSHERKSRSFGRNLYLIRWLLSCTTWADSSASRRLCKTASERTFPEPWFPWGVDEGNHKTFENFQRPRTLWVFFFLIFFNFRNIGTGGSLITPMKLPYQFFYFPTQLICIFEVNNINLFEMGIWKMNL